MHLSQSPVTKLIAKRLNQHQPNTLIAFSNLHRNLNLNDPNFTPAPEFESEFATTFKRLFVPPGGLSVITTNYKYHCFFNFLEAFTCLFVVLYVCCSNAIYVITNKNIFSGLKLGKSRFLVFSPSRLNCTQIYILTFWNTIHSPVITTSV